MSFLKYSCQTQKWFFKKKLWYRNNYFTSYRWKVFGLKSIKTENVNFKIFSIFVFHIRMRTICWIINPINFIKLCALSREKVVLNFFRFFFPQKKEKKEKKLIEVPILILRKYKIQYYNSVFRFISFYFAPDQEYLRM